MESNKVEFDGTRAKLYEEAIIEYPLARTADVEMMYHHLNPQISESIIGFGEGNGYFCASIAESIGSSGKYLITDPSKDQLENLKKRANYPQVEIKVMGVEGLDAPANSFDKVWSFGALHHVPNQTEAMKKIYKSLKSGGKAVICDVFQGSKLAKHFDSQVAKYCVTGHEVKFLSEEFARSICYLAGFKESNVKIIDLPQKWRFDTEEDLGKFIYKLHAMTLLPGSEKQKIKQTLSGCKEILGIEKIDGGYELNWPMRAIIAKK